MSRKDWDREHWQRWMDTVRSNQQDPEDGYGTVGGTPYEGGVFTSATYGSGAEYYSITGMYDNPLLEKRRQSHRGKGPKNYQRPDDRIHEEICELLTHHPLIDATLVEIQVENGEVTINGEVLDRRMKHMTEDVIDGVSGVRDIHNKLKIRRAA
jgi:osmotically-inducible protein OsmY